jgi:3-oxoadipate enol-lactonase
MPSLRLDRETELNYRHTPGTAGRTFVFCNHMGGSTETWEDRIAPGLREEGFGTLTFDYRRQGQTRSSETAQITPEDIVSDIRHVVGSIAPDGPILVGQSIGGLFATRAWLEGAPGEALVLMNTLRVPGPRIDWITELEERLLELGGTRLLMDTLSPMLTGPEELARLRATHLQPEPYAPMEATAPRLRLAGAARRADWNLPYESLTLPTLVLTGMKDRLFRVQSDVERLLARMPDARQVLFPHAGHALHLEEPDRLIAVLAEFGRTRNVQSAAQPEKAAS